MAGGYYVFLGRIESAGPDLASRVGNAAWPLYAIQGLRTLALLLAAGAFLRIIKGADLHRRRMALLAGRQLQNYREQSTATEPARVLTHDVLRPNVFE